MFTDKKEKKALIVDDMPLLRMLLSMQLRGFGYSHIEQAASGEDALKRLADFIPNVIITDLNMPIMDGCAFAAALRLDPALKSLPVILSTTEPMDREAWSKCGFSAYLQKPFTREELKKALASVA